MDDGVAQEVAMKIRRSIHSYPIGLKDLLFHIRGRCLIASFLNTPRCGNIQRTVKENGDQSMPALPLSLMPSSICVPLGQRSRDKAIR